MESNSKNSKKYLRRNYFSEKNKEESENSKTNNNYQNSLISEILKNNKSLKLFAIGDKNNINNVNNIKTNIQKIFSNDESKLKAIKYIIRTRREKRESSPSYKINNKELFPKGELIRESTPSKPSARKNNNLFNNDIDNNKVGNYNKRNILQMSSDNILFSFLWKFSWWN